MERIEELLQQAAAEIADDLRARTEEPSLVEDSITSTAQEIVRVAYDTALQIREMFPKGPIPAALPSGPRLENMSAEDRVELDRIHKDVYDQLVRDSNGRYAAYAERHRQSLQFLFTASGVKSHTAEELVKEILSE